MTIINGVVLSYLVLAKVQLCHDAAVVTHLHHELVALHLEAVEVHVQEGVLAGDQESAA